MATVMAQPLGNLKKAMIIPAELQGAEPSLTTLTKYATYLEATILNPPNYVKHVARENQQQPYGTGNDNVIVRTLSKQGRLQEALHMLNQMTYRGIISAEPDTYVSVLKSCVNEKILSEGKFVHAHIIHTGLKPSTFLGNALVIMYTKCGNLADARRVLDQMPVRNVVSWTALISACAKHGHSEEALALFYEMKRKGTQPNEFTFVGTLSACANMGIRALRHGKEIHEEIKRIGCEVNVFLASALVDMYVKGGSIDDARDVFDKMHKRDAVLWNTMIAGYARIGKVEEAEKLFERMPERNVVSWTTMIAGFAQHGQIGEALKLFRKMPERNVVSWNAMIAGYGCSGQMDEALKLFREMPARNVVSRTTMITAYLQNGFVDEALKLFVEMPERDVVSWNAMISGYAQNGQVDKALKLFQEMPEKNVAAWNAMIAGCAQNGYYGEALELFQQMRRAGAMLNLETFASVLSACANSAALEQGKEIHEDLIRSGFQVDAFVGNALVDMYAKCGSLGNARKLFDRMPGQDVVSWTAMIAGYAMHGFGNEALQLFEQMQCSGMKPDHVTFVAVLSACCHAGLVEDGWRYFNSMSRDYHITPIMEHYCCIVDLLGRAGLLHEAQDFINTMPIEPDAAVWASMLAACRMHTNIDLGEYAAERLFELEPKSATPYVLLSNLYAAAGRWDRIEKVRKLMKDRRVKKKPGCSWIEVNKQLFTFLVGDRSHPQTQEILAELERLSGQMKEEGYLPNTQYALNDLEEEQKEDILCYHSEKLAIAFGLINTSPETPIRIVKNLRICGDCHSATKIISKIAAREIVVRDTHRYHHFKNGQCSCGDYW